MQDYFYSSQEAPSLKQEQIGKKQITVDCIGMSIGWKRSPKRNKYLVNEEIRLFNIVSFWKCLNENFFFSTYEYPSIVKVHYHLYRKMFHVQNVYKNLNLHLIPINCLAYENHRLHLNNTIIKFQTKSLSFSWAWVIHSRFVTAVVLFPSEMCQKSNQNYVNHDMKFKLKLKFVKAFIDSRQLSLFVQKASS